MTRWLWHTDVPAVAPCDPAAELAAQPLAGCVLVLPVDVPGLPANFAQA